MNARGYLATLSTVLLLSLPLIDGGAQGVQDSAWTAGYAERGVSMRARGLNGAFVGVVDDATSTVYNPSGLASLEGPQVMGTLERLNFSTMLSFIAAAMPYGDRLDSNSTVAYSFGAAWMHLHSGEFERRTESDVSFGEFSIGEGTMFFSAAAAIRPRPRWRVSGGLTQKFLYQNVYRMRWGSGVDVGMQAKFMQTDDDTSQDLATFGVSYVNLVQPNIGSADESLDRVPRVIKMGASVVLPHEWNGVNARVACELDFTKRWTWDTKFMMGVELTREMAGQSTIAVRSGVVAFKGHDNSLSFGIGIRIPLTSSRVDADLILAENIEGADRDAIVRSDVVRTSLSYTWLQEMDTVVVDTGTDSTEVDSTAVDSAVVDSAVSQPSARDTVRTDTLRHNTPIKILTDTTKPTWKLDSRMPKRVPTEQVLWASIAMGNVRFGRWTFTPLRDPARVSKLKVKDSGNSDLWRQPEECIALLQDIFQIPTLNMGANYVCKE